MMVGKKGFEFNFAWLFAVIVGATIIFLAIYAATRGVESQTTIINTKTAATFGTLLHPVETSIESGKYTTISFPGQTRIRNTCQSIGDFGRQELSTTTKSGIGEEWPDEGVPVSFNNKYIFSDRVEEGQEFHAFVKPFSMPYKVGDLIMLSSQNYCFVNPPTDIEDEIEALGMLNVRNENATSPCEDSEIEVCFGPGSCDVEVNLVTKRVIKGERVMEYEGDLIYAAIMSNPTVYECQVVRLAKRAGALAKIYASKTDYLSSRGCSSNLGSDLRQYVDLSQIEDSEGIKDIWTASKELERRNGLLNCKLF